MENQKEKNMEYDMETIGPFKGVYRVSGYYPNNGESNGKDNGKCNGNGDYRVVNRDYFYP